MPRTKRQETVAFKALKKQVDRLEQSKKLDELEGTIPTEDVPEMNMLRVGTEDYDIFGDPMGIVTASRLKDYSDSFQFAKSFVVGKHHRMLGNRYGKHSLLIRKEYFDDGRIDPYLLSAFPYREILINEKGHNVEYYKIRMLITDMLATKLLLTRIPTSDGKARLEQIQHAGAKAMGIGWSEEKSPVPPSYIPSYTDKRPQGDSKIKKAVDSGFSEVQQ